MNPLFGNVIVLIVLAALVGLSVRSLWKNRGHACDGDCSHCGHCDKKI
ncbi:MAG: FeoB-associated Cys-rich membrane protein [Oscillibacter sp.]|nr:FeoB-associated Cys-rich membrane protein [Oscillibacter sp.]